MPEGHSIHRLARQFSSVFSARRLAASSPQGRFAEGAALLDGRVLRGASAHGKQLFLEFDGGLFLRVHLGLYGAWSFGGDSTFLGASSIGAPRRVGERESTGSPDGGGYAGPPEPVGAVRVRLVSDHGWADLRGPTACEVITEPERAAVVARLGPDPLARNDDDGGNGARGDEGGTRFTHAIRRSASPVGALLMNQAVIAGVGNVYRAEVLFLQRLYPWRPGKSLSVAESAELWNDIVRTMGDGVRDGRIVTTRPEDRPDRPGKVAKTEAHYVYGRAGLPCRRCGTPVALADLGARKLYWCPNCQAA